GSSSRRGSATLSAFTPGARRSARPRASGTACAAASAPLVSLVSGFIAAMISVEEERMPHAAARDGSRLYYEEAGSGTPVLFIHEFAGDYRSWEPQLRFFSRYFRCIAYNARGFPPSDVPEEAARYSQEHARDDAIAVLDHMRLERAHIVGLSMGGF